MKAAREYEILQLRSSNMIRVDGRIEIPGQEDRDVVLMIDPMRLIEKLADRALRNKRPKTLAYGGRIGLTIVPAKPKPENESDFHDNGSK